MASSKGINLDVIRLTRRTTNRKISLNFSGNALDEDLNIGELSLSALGPDLQKDNDNDTNSVCSSLSTGFPAASSCKLFSIDGPETPHKTKSFYETMKITIIIEKFQIPHYIFICKYPDE